MKEKNTLAAQICVLSEPKKGLKFYLLFEWEITSLSKKLHYQRELFLTVSYNTANSSPMLSTKLSFYANNYFESLPKVSCAFIKQLVIKEGILGISVGSCMAGPLTPRCPFVILAITAEAVLSLSHLSTR